MVDMARDAMLIEGDNLRAFAHQGVSDGGDPIMSGVESPAERRYLGRIAGFDDIADAGSDHFRRPNLGWVVGHVAVERVNKEYSLLQCYVQWLQYNVCRKSHLLSTWCTCLFGIPRVLQLSSSSLLRILPSP